MIVTRTCPASAVSMTGDPAGSGFGGIAGAGP